MHLSTKTLPALAAAAAVLASGCGAGSPAARPQGQRPTRAAAAAHFEALHVPTDGPARSVSVPILTYHRVHRYATEATKSVPDLTVEPAAFAGHLSALANAGYHAISQRQLFDALYRGSRLPARPFLISVDDGYVDDVSVILPLLKRMHMVATFYVITRRFHESGFVTAAQVRQLEQAGMDIGAHTRTHVTLTGLDSGALSAEVAGSRADLEGVLGHPIYWFAYPFGAFDGRVVAAVRRAGYLLAVTTRAGSRERSDAPLTLPRLHVGRMLSAGSLLAQVSAGDAFAAGKSAG
ncbi:MAG: hypothetical protein NVSMB25_07320 [Thermoleophilaceae bacterium]